MTDAEMPRVVMHADTLEALAELIADLVSQSIDLSPPDAVTMLRLVRTSRQRLSDVERALEQQIAEGMTTKLSEDGQVERNWSATTRWDADYLFPRVLAASRDERKLNEETGEIEPAEEAFMRLIREAAGIGYWRVTALKRMGVDVSEARETSGGRWTIRLHGEGA